MNENSLFFGESLAVVSNTAVQEDSQGCVYEIMHMEKLTATITMAGGVKIIDEQFMPYDLYLEEAARDDIEGLINNLNNFNYWCASRVLSLDRKYAKEIMNSIGVAQAVTDKDRASISLSYHCVSLTDVFWVRKRGEGITFSQINLYDNPLNEAVVELSLRGRQMTVTNQELAPDLSTKGCFPKAWIRSEHGFRLLKDGGEDTVKRELLASEICQCFAIPQVIYRKHYYQGQIVTESDIVTSKERSMVSKMAFEVYASNHDFDVIEECKRIDPLTYYGMNLLDYLTGNTDRHPENWGVLVDNETNKYIGLYPLMDFNQCFMAYENLEGANCQTMAVRGVTQMAAAIEAVQQIGLPMLREMDMRKFEGMEKEAEMFLRRLNLLKEIVKTTD